MQEKIKESQLFKKKKKSCLIYILWSIKLEDQEKQPDKSTYVDTYLLS